MCSLLCSTVKERFIVVQQLMLRLARPTDFEPRLAKTRHVISMVENGVDLIAVTELNPDHIQTNTDKAKVRLFVHCLIIVECIIIGSENLR